MLARSSVLTHKSGFTFATPLLVPSFSSKGFLFQKKGKTTISEAKKLMDITAPALSDPILVSAYDLHHKYIDTPKRIAKIGSLTFIDSGGYEVAQYHDLSAVFKFPVTNTDWSEEQLMGVLDSWPKGYPAVIISYDMRGRKYMDQIRAARKLFGRYPDQIRDFLVKPEKTNQQFVDIDALLPHVREFNQFDIVGITEKELGNSLLNRMLNIAKLREALDSVHLAVPIHIFGSLDPLSSSLYFFAGAEIFDGLTWLRYSYSEGKALYRHNHGAVAYGIHEEDEVVQARSMRENVYYMKRLQFELRKYLGTGKFDAFGYNRKELKDAYDVFKGERGGLR